MQKLLISTAVATFILFLWSSITQALPWGVTNTQNITVTAIDDNEKSNISNLKKLPPHSLTTGDFDKQFNNKVSTYTTNKTLSWIVTQPLKSDYTSYFVNEAITQLLVGLFLSIILLLTTGLGLMTRLILIVLAASAASAGNYGQLMNWWGLPPSYGFGVSVNLVIGWVLSSFVTARFIIKSKIS